MRALIAVTMVSFVVAACGAAEDVKGESSGGQNGDEKEPAVVGGDPTQPGSCKLGAPHLGFANVDFVANRKAGGVGVDRRRGKPFSALPSEFQRALGTVPRDLPTVAATYGDVPARWYEEPTVGPVSLYAMYNVAFTGCYDTMTAPEFAVAPSAQTASVECARMQRKFWQRTATPDEAKACVDFTLGLTNETVPRRRWAHACASIMISTGFTTY